MLNILMRYKSKFSLISISSLQVIVSFLTSVLILRHLGLGDDLDIFYIGLAVFYFLYTSINWSISSILAPYLIEHRGEGREGSLFVTVLLLVLPIAALMYLSMPIWIDYLYINYAGTVDKDKIILIQSILIGAYIVDGFILVFTAMLQEQNRYITFNLSMLFASIIALIFVFISLEYLGVYAAALNQLIMKGVVLIIMCCMFLPLILRTLSFDKEQFKLIFSRVKYLILGSLYYRTDDVVEKIIASYLSGGFVSLVAFIQRVYGAIITVLNSVVGVPAITVFGDLIVDKKYHQATNSLVKRTVGLLLTNGVLFLGLMLFGESLFVIVIDETLTPDLESILHNSILCLYVYVFGKTITQLSQSMLLALNKQSISVAYDAFTYTISLLLKVVLTIKYGIDGFLIAIVISVFIADGAKLLLAFKELSKAQKSP